MSVYKEGYHIVESIMNQSRQIFPDAADFGVPVTENDSNWNDIKQLVEWYGVKETRRIDKWNGGSSVECIVELMDEWAVSDRHKTEDEALERFKVYYTSHSGKIEGKIHSGIVMIEALKP